MCTIEVNSMKREYKKKNNKKDKTKDNEVRSTYDTTK